MERHNQVAGIVYRNICTEYGLEVPILEWKTPPKVVENDWARILWDLQIQTDKLVLANQPDIMLIEKEQRKAVLIDVAIPCDSNIRKMLRYCVFYINIYSFIHIHICIQTDTHTHLSS